MESQRSPSSYEHISGPLDPNAPVLSKESSKSSKTKKTALPRGAIANAPTETNYKGEDTSRQELDKGHDKIRSAESIFSNAEKLHDRSDEDDTSPTPPLDHKQAREVLETYAGTRAKEVEAEAHEHDDNSPVAHVANANHTLLENIREHAQHPEHKTADEVLDIATSSTVEELRLAQEDSGPDGVDTDTLMSPTPPPRLQAKQKEAVIASILTETADHTAQPSEDAPSNTPGAPPTPPRPPRTNLYGSHESQEPEPQSETTPEPMPFSNALAQDIQPASAETSAWTTASVKPEKAVIVDRRRGDIAAGVLLGGIAGYAIGRHGERKRSKVHEKQLNKQHSSEVAALEHKIVQKEQYIRSLAAKKTAVEQATAAKPQQEHLSTRHDTSSQNTSVAPRHDVAHPNTTESISAPPLRPRVPATEKTQPISEKPHVADAKPFATRPERPAVPVVLPRQEQILAVKPVEKMHVAEVMAVAKTIKIGSRPLESYYRSGQIDERSVRRLVTEHRRTGGHAERMLYTEMRTTAERRRHGPATEQQPIPEQQTAQTVTTPLAATKFTNSPDGDAPVQAQYKHTSQTASTQAADDVASDYTPRFGASRVMAIVAAVVIAFLLLQIIF